MSIYEISVLAGMFVVTFTIRYILIGFSSHISLPESLERALVFVPPAVLTAIVLPTVLMPNGNGFDFSIGNAYIPAALSALVTHIIFKRLLLTIVLGMFVFFIWKLYF